VVVEAAYARCRHLARQHYENFPVASLLLPRALRPDVAAVYAFARLADDFADEGRRAPAARLALLDDWLDRLRAAAAGAPVAEESDAGAIFLALSETIRRHRLEPELFEDLLRAFRQDVTVARYESWTDLDAYCRRSANPVGRLVLRIAGRRDAGFDGLSDEICTALQLVNFWQDLDLDQRKGRLYVPLEELRRAGAAERDLASGRLTPAWQRALSACARRTRERFEAGRPLARAVGGWLGWELRATWSGGMRILERLEARGFDVFTCRPTLGWRDGMVIAGRSIMWPR
jgi:phytoene synthase